jgi:hypothetical protein
MEGAGWDKQVSSILLLLLFIPHLFLLILILLLGANEDDNARNFGRYLVLSVARTAGNGG